MKRFVITILGVTMFCIGLGALVDRASAKFKSDERALALIKQARLAIGGDQSIAEIRSMIIRGNTTLNFRTDGASRTEQGESEIALQLPDKMSKTIKIGREDGAAGGERIVNKEHDVIILRKGGTVEAQGEGAGQAGRKVIIEKVEGAGDGEKAVAGNGGVWKTTDDKTVVLRKADGPAVGQEVVVHDKGDVMFERHHDNELLRTTLALLLTAPEGIEVNYLFGGEGDVDGTPCNIVNAEAAGSSFKLYLSKASSLPVMISYQGHAMPRVMVFKTKTDAGVPAEDKAVTFTTKVDAPEMAEIQVRFSDFRGVNGVQLPYKWTTTVAGQPGEVFDVTGYEINPANIADKFKNEKVMWKTKKDGQ